MTFRCHLGAHDPKEIFSNYDGIRDPISSKHQSGGGGKKTDSISTVWLEKDKVLLTGGQIRIEILRTSVSCHIVPQHTGSTELDTINCSVIKSKMRKRRSPS